MGKRLKVIPVKSAGKQELSDATEKDGKLFVPVEMISLTVSGGIVEAKNER
jgi:hypothetical protein